jgi:hypothetical protein
MELRKKLMVDLGSSEWIINCTQRGQILIRRHGYQVLVNLIHDGCCPICEMETYYGNDKYRETLCKP